MTKFYNHSLIILGSLILTACTLPQPGPNVSEIKNTKNIEIIPMTIEESKRIARTEKLKQDYDIEKSIKNISSGSYRKVDHKITIGDSLSIKVQGFTFSHDGSSQLITLLDTSSDVSSNGTINPPYIHHVHIAGMTIPDAQDLLTNQYKNIGQLDNLAVSLTRSSSNTKGGAADSDGIIVTGTISHPEIIPWSGGSMTTARAITLAMSNGSNTLNTGLNEDKDNERDSDFLVSVSRKEKIIAQIPISTALEQDIPLQPADHIIIRRHSAVKAIVMGGGINKNGVYNFPEQPTLAEAIARAGGLNPNTADSSEIFVFHKDYEKDKPILYTLNLRDASSIIMEQIFPIQNGDIVYVSEAEIVPSARLLSILLQFGLAYSFAR